MARATAALFSFYLQKLDLNNLPWNDLCQQSLDCFWPKDLPKSTQPFPHAETLRKEPADAWLSQLVASIPSINVPKIDSYMAALETFLLDYELSKTEKSQLIILAENCGIRRSQVDEIHRKAFQLMVIRTMEDGIIDEYEKAKLADLGATFGIPKAEVERYMHDLKLIDAKNSLAISYSTQA